MAQPPQGDRRDIIHVMMPMFSGTKDDFGKEVAPQLPLSFDRVNEGRVPRSGSPLFKLPFELLGEILQHIPDQSLAPLALVNRDCRQWARSRQFTSVQLSYSPSSLAIVDRLLAEVHERQVNRGMTFLPSLGACIRRLTVATDPTWVEQRHNLRSLDTLGETELDRLLNEASVQFYDAYLPKIRSVLSSGLPHLELLDWEDMIKFDKSYFDSFSDSPIQHLKLFRSQVNEEFHVNLPPPLHERGWPLRTLFLEIMWDFFAEGELAKGSVVPLSSSILSLCAGTLESLTWNGETVFREGSPQPSIDVIPIPAFRRLHTLQLNRPPLLNPSTLHSLIPPEGRCRLRRLSADIEGQLELAEFLGNRGRVSSLECFVWYGFVKKEDSSLAFLAANSHILKLAIPFEAHPGLLNTRILPMLSKSFSNLVSLRLTWKDKTIPAKALHYIGELGSLEQICLSAGNQFGWRHDWLIDHNALRSCLSKLPRLKKLAFSRDSYDNRMTWSSVERYYVDKILDQMLMVLVREEEETEEEYDRRCTMVWELAHKSLMMKEANKYIAVMPNLQWVYFGQIPMGVGIEEGRRLAVALHPERDECWTLLHKMFNWDTYDA